MIIANVNANQVKVNLASMDRAVDTGVPKALMDVGLELLRLSQLEVPHDTGYLQDSGVVEIIGNNVVLGYHTPYAARMHEHPEYRFQKGRKGKYIEDPVLRNSKVLGLKFGGSMYTQMKGSI